MSKACRRMIQRVHTSETMVPPAHVPFRQCVGCRARFPKQSLVRFVRLELGGWQADPAARLPGRGAYLCSRTCRDKVRKNKRFAGLAEVPTSALPAAERTDSVRSDDKGKD
jgi:predicted RNA-binding protein YlxR (DUF448 family)